MGYPHLPTFRLEHWEGLCTVSLMNYFQELHPALSFPGSRGSFVWGGRCPLPSVSLPVAHKAVTSSPTSSTFRVSTYRLWGFSGYCSGKLIGSYSSWPLLHSSIQLIWWYVTLPGWSHLYLRKDQHSLCLKRSFYLPHSWAPRPSSHCALLEMG